MRIVFTTGEAKAQQIELLRTVIDKATELGMTFEFGCNGYSEAQLNLVPREPKFVDVVAPTITTEGRL